MKEIDIIHCSSGRVIYLFRTVVIVKRLQFTCYSFTSAYTYLLKIKH